MILVSRTRFILRGKDMSEAMRQWRCWFTSWILRQRLLLTIVSIHHSVFFVRESEPML